MLKKVSKVFWGTLFTMSLLLFSGSSISQAASINSAATPTTVSFTGSIPVKPKPPVNGGDDTGTSSPTENGGLSPIELPKVIGTLPQTSEKANLLTSYLGLFLILLALMLEIMMQIRSNNFGSEVER